MEILTITIMTINVLLMIMTLWKNKLIKYTFICTIIIFILTIISKDSPVIIFIWGFNTLLWYFNYIIYKQD